jgi:hypothetical protein
MVRATRSVRVKPRAESLSRSAACSASVIAAGSAASVRCIIDPSAAELQRGPSGP